MSGRAIQTHGGSMRRHQTGERGITVVVFAVAATVLLAMGALVLGSSIGYTSVRDAQNGADAAALAATNKLREVRFQDGEVAPTALPPDVLDTAVDVAEDNDIDVGSVQCDIVAGRYAVAKDDVYVLGPCGGTTLTIPNELLPLAAGVRVTVSDTGDVPFGEVVGQDSITADARAAATVQSLRGGFSAPFMVCANAGDHGDDLLEPAPGLDPPYVISDDVVGDLEILLWSNGNGFGDRNCGVAPWHGLVNTDYTYQIPSDPTDDEGWWDIDTGSRVGQIERLLAGDDTCDWNEINTNNGGNFNQLQAAVGCQIALPMCVDTAGNGTNARLQCVRLAVFEITYVGAGDEDGSCVSVNKKVICGRILPGGGLATGGQGTLNFPDEHEVAVIKIVE